MIHWKDVTRATALAALLAGTTAAQPPGRVPPGDLPPFPPPPFGHAWLEPRVEGVPSRGEPEASLFEVPAGFEIEEGHR